MKLLLANGASPNDSDGSGYTALIIACNSGRAEVAKILLGYGGCDCNQASSQGMHSLMYAAAAGQQEVVRLLVDSGANVDLKDNVR